MSKCDLCLNNDEDSMRICWKRNGKDLCVIYRICLMAECIKENIFQLNPYLWGHALLLVGFILIDKHCHMVYSVSYFK